MQSNSIKAFWSMLSQQVLIIIQMKVILIKSLKLHIPWGIAIRKMVFSTFIMTMF